MLFIPSKRPNDQRRHPPVCHQSATRHASLPLYACALSVAGVWVRAFILRGKCWSELCSVRLAPLPASSCAHAAPRLTPTHTKTPQPLAPLPSSSYPTHHCIQVHCCATLDVSPQPRLRLFLSLAPPLPPFPPTTPRLRLQLCGAGLFLLASAAASPEAILFLAPGTQRANPLSSPFRTRIILSSSRRRPVHIQSRSHCLLACLPYVSCTRSTS